MGVDGANGRRAASGMILAVLACAALGGCDLASPTGSGATVSGVLPTPSDGGSLDGGLTSRSPRAPSDGNELVVGLLAPDGRAFRPSFLSNSAFDHETAVLAGRVHSQLLVRGPDGAPVPELATEPCSASPDGRVLACRIVRTSFHDGSALTADDVAFTYNLAATAACPFGDNGYRCPGELLDRAVAVDPATVEFHLREAAAPFVTVWMTGLGIESRAMVEAQHAVLMGRASQMDPGVVSAAAGALARQLEAGDCSLSSTAVSAARDVLATAGANVWPDAEFADSSGAIDDCAAADHVRLLANDLANALDATGLASIAWAHRLLPINRAPLGSGPWRFVEFRPGQHVLFERNPDYHGKLAAADRLRYVFPPDMEAAASAVAEGRIAIVELPESAESGFVERLRNDPRLAVAQTPVAAWLGLQLNNRPGQLFSDRRLRQALQLCIDKPRVVEAATQGSGTPLWSDIPPASWAWDPAAPVTQRDPEAAVALLEAAGWTPDADGIRRNGDRRLAVKVYIREHADAARGRFVELVAEQTLECGIEIKPIRTNTTSISSWPHNGPDTPDQPFEAYMGGYVMGFDPDTSWHWHSRVASSETQPDSPNYSGFTNPRLDALLDQALQTYDIGDRRGLYSEVQKVLADEVPIVFGYAPSRPVLFDRRLASAGEPLDFSALIWDWELHQLHVAEG